MEETMEVSMEQELPAAEEPVEAAATEGKETDEVLSDEAEPAAEESITVEAGAVESPVGIGENEVPEEGPPGINPANYAGWLELARAHPEVVGKPLPDDIMKACVESGLLPLRVYESMMLKKQGEQIAALQQEIATLRQNAEAAQRAPVTAASLGGNEGNDPNDEFMRGFNS